MAASASARSLLTARTDLGRRATTAAVLTVATLGAIWLGELALGLFVLGAVAGMHWEWTALILPRTTHRDRLVFTAFAVATSAWLAHHLSPAGIGLDPQTRPGLVLAAVAAFFLAWGVARLAGRRGMGERKRSALFPPVLIYPAWIPWFCPAAVAALWLRQAHGAEALIWPIMVVCLNDIGAYAAGRAIGGPKLVPRLSPSKTWSGLIGGLAAGTAAGGAWALVAGGPVGAAAAAALAVAAVGVAGDLGQSAVKRRARVKDSGNLLPGHGGVFDRLDSHLAALPLFAGVVWASGWSP